ncbi:hypothetical protein [uncultured Jatrophihabitans sp.]|uniref:hypothetical protein n=1 Tax=uncultured Jatrophihabitans sp. TaxID=1610747 RepID=UPI0035CA08EB
MFSLVYIVVVLIVLGAVGFLALTRGGTPDPRGSARRALRTLTAAPSDDIVDRMANSLLHATQFIDQTFAACPTHLGAVLPRHLFDAFSAAKGALAAAVTQRYADMLLTKGRDGGFVLPSDYVLRLQLSVGSPEAFIAAYKPITDLHAALREAGQHSRALPPRPTRDAKTTFRPPKAGDGPLPPVTRSSYP